MNPPDSDLPTNRNFGFFFSGVFLAASCLFYIWESKTASYSLAGLGILFLITTLVSSENLLPLNKLWMRFGSLLGYIVNPIVLGFIFFVLFTPMGIAMRLFGRDELRLRLRKKDSYWITLDSSNAATGPFKNQF